MILYLLILKWFLSESLVLMLLILIGIWKIFGYNILIVLLGFKFILNYIYEVFKLDNVNKIMNFFKVILLLLLLIIFFFMIIIIIVFF